MAAVPSTQPNYYLTVGLPIFTLLLGYCGSLFTEWRRDKRLEARERKAREELRQQAIEDRRASFQRETLLMLSELLFDIINIGSKIAQVYKTTNAGITIDSELGNEFENTVAKISRYRVRVLDDELRALINKLQKHVFAQIFSKTANSEKDEYNNSLETFNKANERLGVLLRELY